MSFLNPGSSLPPVTIEDLNGQTDFADRQYENRELKEMFFRLGFIHDNGSGVRRAQKTMKDNGSPDLVFRPLNGTDDNTLVIAYVNGEWAGIREEENHVSEKSYLKSSREAVDLNGNHES